jgi:hypothetical protein
MHPSQDAEWCERERRRARAMICFFRKIESRERLHMKIGADLRPDAPPHFPSLLKRTLNGIKRLLIGAG